MCLGSAAGRHKRFGDDRSRPFAQERPCAMLALDDKVLDMRGRTTNLALVVERLSHLSWHFDAGDVIGFVGRCRERFRNTHWSVDVELIKELGPECVGQ
jgi:hypothetical protein